MLIKQQQRWIYPAEYIIGLRRTLIGLIYRNTRKAVVYTLLFCKFTPPQSEGIFTQRGS